MDQTRPSILSETSSSVRPVEPTAKEEWCTPTMQTIPVNQTANGGGPGDDGGGFSTLS